jgi:hypothetical protein
VTAAVVAATTLGGADLFKLLGGGGSWQQAQKDRNIALDSSPLP